MTWTVKEKIVYVIVTGRGDVPALETYVNRTEKRVNHVTSWEGCTDQINGFSMMIVVPDTIVTVCVMVPMYVRLSGQWISVAVAV